MRELGKFSYFCPEYFDPAGLQRKEDYSHLYCITIFCNMRKILSVLIVISALPLALSAQRYYPGALEFGGGPSCGFFRVSGDAGNAVGSTGGGNYFFRYTHYFGGNFGAYAQVKDVITDACDYQYFGAMNKADGGKYRYRFNSGCYDLEYNPLFTAGAAYRRCHGPVDLVFRAGLGYGERNYDFIYERQTRDGSIGPEYIKVSTIWKGKTEDYLLDSEYYGYYYSPALVFFASAQFVWKVMKRLYLFGEAGLDCSPSKSEVSTTTTGSKTDYDPINWVEAVSYANRKDVWVRDGDSAKTTTDRLGMGTHLNLSFGIGVNLWKENK